MLEPGKFTLIAKTLAGLEGVLEQEIKEAGGENIQQLNRAVQFEGDLRLIYKLNINCRSALHILRPITSFEVKKQQDLYNQIQKLPWETLISPNHTLAVNSVVQSDVYSHSGFVSRRVKDAVVDKLRAHYNKRPDVELENPDFRIEIYLFKNYCSVSLDTSGRSLHYRGYRMEQGEAPLNEVLAAGLVLLSGWNGENAFLDPMCGSGTILTEAALLASRTAPNLNREKFSFMAWPDYDQDLFQEEQQKAKDAIIPLPVPITGSDASAKAVGKAKENLKRAGFKGKAGVSCKSFEQTQPPAQEGTIIMNPPYGERMQKEDIKSFYRSIGDHLKQYFKGYRAWILSGNPEALKMIGLKPMKKYSLYNGSIPCKFHGFELFSGSWKGKKQQEAGNVPG